MNVIQPYVQRLCDFTESFAFVALRVPGLFIYEIWFRFITGTSSTIDAATINDQVSSQGSFDWYIS